MADYLGNDYPSFENSLQMPAFKGIRYNPKKISRELLLDTFPSLNNPTPFAKNGLYASQALGNHPFHAAGAIYMQEPSASAAAGLLDIQPDSTVLDLCAAPGSKSSQILEYLDDDKGFLLSNEINDKRARILLSNMERMGGVNFAITSMDTHTLCTQFEECFDRILADAPCSGEGMMKKHDAAKDEWSMDNIRHCAIMQKDILDDACLALKKGGILVYSTCTYAKEENEEQIAGLLKSHPEMELMEILADFGREGFETEGMDAKKVRRIFPMDGGEGHFIAKLKKTKGSQKALPALKSSPLPKEAADFLKAYPKAFSCFHIEKTREGMRIFGMNHPFIKIKKGRVLRQGVYIGDVIKKRFEPQHAFFLNTWMAEDFKGADLDLKQAENFLKGMAVEVQAPKGFVPVSYKGIIFGFGKSDGRIIKNKYPKGLRLMAGSSLPEEI